MRKHIPEYLNKPPKEKFDFLVFLGPVLAAVVAVVVVLALGILIFR